jgi:hypothetical protein
MSPYLYTTYCFQATIETLSDSYLDAKKPNGTGNQVKN